MKYTSIIEKISCLFQILSNNIIYPIFILLVALLTILMLTKKINKIKYFILMIINYLILLTITIINNYKEMGKLLDNISTNFFKNIYFPSAYTYLFVLILIGIITIKSILNKEEKPYKIANYICFSITNFLFILIINIITSNKIDIFTKKSLFSNTNLIILLELTMNIFILWLLARTIIYTTTKIVESIELDKIIESNNNIALNNTLVVENINNTPQEQQLPKKEDYVLSKNNVEVKEKVIDNNINDTFSLNDLIFASRPTKVVEQPKIESNASSEQLLDQLLNNGLPIIHKEEKVEEKQKDSYTLNDYRIFNKILKDIRETNNSNIITINKELENILINKYTEEEYKLFKVMLKNYSN